MKLQQIADLVEGSICTCTANGGLELTKAFTSDLMSDVLRFPMDETLLITGLCNTQTIRTAEMADLQVVIIGRGKQPDEEMLSLAEESDITIITSKLSLFMMSAILYNAGLQPPY